LHLPLEPPHPPLELLRLRLELLRLRLELLRLPLELRQQVHQPLLMLSPLMVLGLMMMRLAIHPPRLA
jgi:hypothetical protein